MTQLPIIKIDVTAPLTKLVEVVSAGIGAWAEPSHIREKAKAVAEAALTMTEVEVAAEKIRAQGEYETEMLRNRNNLRLATQELRNQRNIESIINKARAQLPPAVDTVPVDEDWIAQFFEYSKSVGNQEMQLIWAKILAGEVAKPGSFSLRTLSSIKIMGERDAKLFQSFCNRLWYFEPILFDIASDRLDTFEPGHQKDLIHFESLGLIHISSAPAMSMSLSPPASVNFRYFNTIYNLKPTIEAVISYRSLTRVGEEILPLCRLIPDVWHEGSVLQYFRNELHIEVSKIDATSV